MVTKKFLLTVLLPVLLCLFCMGCSVPVRSYIWNTTSVQQTIIVRYIDLPNKEVQLYISDSKQAPYYDLIDELQKSIKARKIEANMYEFKIPPNSTVFLEQSLNFRSLLYESIKIGNVELITTDGLYSSDFITKKSINKYTIWFRIE
ncbi:MAG: hypothetical protein Q8J69_05415 [Sphingobacteriaceae bacterium]|nr:hypothetical protein [Sphingobacteriaceae bacterium]